MKLYLDGHGFKYESEKICRIYFPTEKFEFIENECPGELSPGDIYTKVAEDENGFSFFASCNIGGKESAFSETAEKKDCPENYHKERFLARCITRVLTCVTGIQSPWGILTGVRPSKLMLKYIADEGQARAEEIFRGFLRVSPSKTALATAVANAEQKIISLSKHNSFSLYISIPFCPTRCSYCSFVSHSIAAAKKLIPDYVRLLCEEIEYTAKITKAAGLNLETVYMGGGTPTSLGAEDLYTITKALNDNFGADKCREFTVEAGRPDTITREKLTVLKNAGVGRISINPQTFSAPVLENIGRKHTPEDIYEKFALARQCGFDNINMDFIAGLPGDSYEGFCDSIDKALALRPENITVHTLALKTAAQLVTSSDTDSVCTDTVKMLDAVSVKLPAQGYSPYYMYRQSKSVGNLENVGWSLDTKECLYNVYMMEEIHSVIAVGGGAVTKLVNSDTGYIERVYNFKYPYEYISRFPEILERKKNMIIPV